MGKVSTRRQRFVLDIRLVFIAVFGGLVLWEIYDPAIASTPSEEDILAQESPAESFQAYLSESYLAFSPARDHAVNLDWHDANYFRGKGMSAKEGHLPLPEEMLDWDLKPELKGVLSSARERLIAARRALLAQDHVSQARLSELAFAQVHFDCWVERSEENWISDEARYCRYMFESSLYAAHPYQTSASLMDTATIRF